VCFRLGANIPASVPSLIRGCLAVVQAASNAHSLEQTVDEQNDDHMMTSDKNASTVALAAAIQTVEVLSSLSTYENARAATMLRASLTFKSPTTHRLAISLAVAQGNALHLALVFDNFFSTLQHTDYDIMEAALSQKCDDGDSLVTGALKCISADLIACTVGRQFPAGRVRWLLTAYLRLLVFGNIHSCLDLPWMTKFQDNVFLGNLPGDIHQVLVVIAWVGFALSLTSTSNDQGTETTKQYENALRKLLYHHNATFAARVAVTWKSADSQQVGRLLVESMYIKSGSLDIEMVVSKTNLLNACGRLVERFQVNEIIVQRMIADSVAEDLHSASECLQFRTVTETLCLDHVRRSLQNVLSPNSGRTLEYLESDATLSFIVETSKVLCSDDLGKREVPVCLPLDLEKLASTVSNELSPSEQQPKTSVASLLLKLTYTICFLEDQPHSPFRVVIRNLPLDMIYNFLEESSSRWVDPAIRKYILGGLRRSCPEISLQIPVLRALQKFNHTLHRDNKKESCREILIGAIHKSVGKSSLETSGEMIEASFCQSLTSVPWKSLCCSSVSAVLSNGLPLINIEYTKLCSDPVCLLKSSMKCWSCAGFRRVLLTLLFFLIEINEAMVLSLSGGKENFADELNISRNAVLVRCLLALMNKLPDLRGCVFTTGFIRALFARSRGLGAAILREGVMDSAWDWLCLNVPEIMDDATTYQDLLAHISISTANQRLVAASGVLRVALMHGRREEALSEALVVAATQQLIANFFIILGPVGLPVHAFENDQGGDSTKACRKAALRMLKTFSLAQGRRQGVRNECIIALQKLSRMCKGEELVGGLPVSIANRQKGFLRELLDGINKALSAIGSSS
jgi:hypothetical protein